MNFSKYSFTAIAALVTAGFVMTACGEDDPAAPGGTGGSSTSTGGSDGSGGDNTGNTGGMGGDGGVVEPPPGTPEEIVEGNIEADTTWTADKVWVIKGNVWVQNGATLTIEPGTFVQGFLDSDNPAVLIITREGKINAVGEADKPIVFTSKMAAGERTSGDWGGLVLLGKATNNSGTEVAIEGLATTDTRKNHGGTDDTHDCGKLAYVRVEYAGIDLGNGDEVNGITFGSCGSDTEVHHVMVSNALDDGFEWFGGTMTASELVVNNAGDDSFDADMGARITLTNIFARQVFPQTGDPNGFEWDNNASNFAATPVTEVTVENATLCGEDGNNNNARYGMVLRRGVTGSITNVAVVGFTAGASLRDTPWNDNAQMVSLAESVFNQNGALTHTSSTTVDAEAWFTGGTNNVTTSPGYNPANCLGAGVGRGPVAAVYDSGVGAFATGSDWIKEAWVNWAAN
jgi:hypothetical protein